MLSFRQYRGLANNDAAPKAASSIIEAQSGIESQIDKLVDDWMAELKAELIQGTFVTGQRSMWDRFKNTIANLWHGRQSIDNPYLWQNKLGYDLGRKVESVTNIHMPLHHYKYLYESFSAFAGQIKEAAVLPPGTANLRIMQILDKHATMLKRRLKELFATAPEKAPPAVPAPEPKASAPPAAPAPATSAPSSSSATASNPPAADKDEYHFENLPPEENRDWNSLTQAEKNRWNKLGGGISLRQGSRGGVGVEMPYILRLGDPRHRNLAAAEAGIQNHYKARRVEKAENPIKSKQELEQRVKKVVEKNRSRTQPTAQSGSSTGTGGSGAPRQQPQPTTATEAPASAPAHSREDSDTPAIGTGYSLAGYEKLKTITDMLIPAIDDERKDELKATKEEGIDAAERLRDKIVENCTKLIDEMIDDNEKKARLKEELARKDTDDDLKSFVNDLIHGDL
jgi:hypothetical protein